MQVCTSLQTDNHSSTHHLVSYRPGALPAAQPTALKETNVVIMMMMVVMTMMMMVMMDLTVVSDAAGDAVLGRRRNGHELRGLDRRQQIQRRRRRRRRRGRRRWQLSGPDGRVRVVADQDRTALPL